MIGIEELKLSKTEAKRQYQKYVDALKRRKGGENLKATYKDMRTLYKYLADGKAIFNLRDAWRKADWNEKGEPRLAIAPLHKNAKIDSTIVVDRNKNGELIYAFSLPELKTGDELTVLPSIAFPAGAMPPLPESVTKGKSEGRLPTLNAKIPPIPPEHLPDEFKDCFIIWEVKNWEVKPSDPLLVKRITDTCVVVLAGWDLTEVERALM